MTSNRHMIAIALSVVVMIAAGAPARASDADFVAGKGQATARVWRFNTQYGQVDVPFGVATTLAGYLENHAHASAAFLDPGFLGLANAVKLCGTNVPLPEPTEANTSTNGGKPDVHSKTLSGNEGVGSETAEAYPGSRGVAKATGVDLGIPGLVEMTGGSAVSEARLVAAKHLRTASSTASIGSIKLLGGVAELDGLRWTMRLDVAGIDSRTRKLTKKLSFTFGDATVAGRKLPTGTDAQRRAAVDAINKAINPLGLLIRVPQLRTLSPTSYELTPLFVGIGGKPVYGPPVYDAVANSDNPYSLINVYDKASRGLFDATDCNQFNGAMKQVQTVNALYNTVGLVTPILISAFGSSVTGGSTMGFEFGKTTVQIDDAYYPSPVYPPLPDLGAGLGVEAGPASAPAAPPPPIVAGIEHAAEGSAAPAIALPASAGRRQCRTTSPAGRPGCWDGAGGVAAGAACAVAVGLFAADEARRRRRRRLLVREEVQG